MLSTFTLFDQLVRSFTTRMGSASSCKYMQNIVVMRHGERMDNFDDSWIPNAVKPWDPPLFKEDGHIRALRTGVELRTQLSFPIHRVVTSPFLRCVETAVEVMSGLCDDAIASKHPLDDISRITDVPIVKPTKIKASIEYGLCEMFNNVAIRHPPEDKANWGFDDSKIHLNFPAGTVDPDYEPVIKELPTWGETGDQARARFERVVHGLADKYPSENLLLITHGEGLRASVSTFSNGTKIRKVDYCAYVELQREITQKGHESFSAGNFGVTGHHGYLLRKDDA